MPAKPSFGSSAVLETPHIAIDVRRTSASELAFASIVSLFLVYAAIFIFRTSFVVDGQRYFSLFDDAMISMQYARNLAHGDGLVWNAGGTKVEGFTNPLWVVFMAGLHFMPMAAAKMSLAVQVAAVGFLTANLFFVRRLALAVSGGSQLVSLSAVVLTATYLPLNFWGLEGMEVSVLVLIVSVALDRALAVLAERRFQPSLYVLLGASIWIRPDMVVPFISVMLFLAAADVSNRWRHVFWGTIILLGFSLAQTAFRLWYFGDPLPNTYYLKLTGYPMLLRVARGVEALFSFIWRSNVLLFAVPFALALRRDPEILLLLCVLSAQLLYSTYVGGDAWEFWGGSNRYISIAMPAFFVLLAFGLAGLADFLATAFSGKALSEQTRQLRAFRNMGFLSLIAVSVLSLNSIHGPAALAEFLLLKPPLHSGPGGENDLDVREALALASVTKPAAGLLVARAGTVPYFSQRVGIDLLGKNDAHIAHEPMRRDQYGIRALIAFRPGHMKYDYQYSVETLRPDVVVQLWQHQEEVRPYLAQNYTGVLVAGRCAFFRKGSPNVLWDKLPASPCE